MKKLLIMCLALGSISASAGTTECHVSYFSKNKLGIYKYETGTPTGGLDEYLRGKSIEGCFGLVSKEQDLSTIKLADESIEIKKLSVKFVDENGRETELQITKP